VNSLKLSQKNRAKLSLPEFTSPSKVLYMSLHHQNHSDYYHRHKRSTTECVEKIGVVNLKQNFDN
jgi:hypothetical protein